MEALLDESLFCFTSPLNKSCDFTMLEVFVLASLGKKSCAGQRKDTSGISVTRHNDAYLLTHLFAKSFLPSLEEVRRHTLP